MKCAKTLLLFFTSCDTISIESDYFGEDSTHTLFWKALNQPP